MCCWEQGINLIHRAGMPCFPCTWALQHPFSFFLLTAQKCSLGQGSYTQFLTHTQLSFSSMTVYELVCGDRSRSGLGAAPLEPRLIVGPLGASGWTRRAGLTTLPRPMLAHCAWGSVPPPTSHGCWHLGHGHLLTTCKSQRKCCLEPRPLGVQALSTNHNLGD